MYKRQLLSGEKDCSALLGGLAARGLFIEAIADRSGWYRLHPAFRAVLRRRLETDADALPQLHRVASRYFTGQMMIAEAAEQAALAGDFDQAADQLAAMIMPMIEQGELSRAATWIGRLPATHISARPALVQAQAWLQTLLAAPDAPIMIATLKATGAVDEARAIDLVPHAYRDDKFTDAAEMCDQLLASVSYTHLDVYKRQIQPGMRIEAKAQHRAATSHRVMPSARGRYAPPRFPSDLVGIERWQGWLDTVAMHEICICLLYTSRCV